MPTGGTSGQSLDLLHLFQSSFLCTKLVGFFYRIFPLYIAKIVALEIIILMLLFSVNSPANYEKLRIVKEKEHREHLEHLKHLK